MTSGSTIGEGLYQMALNASSQVPVTQGLRANIPILARACAAAAFLACLWPVAATAQKRPVSSDQDLLARARALYNQQDADGAIAAALEARVLPGAADAADLVLARARLERFRRTSDRADLVAARETLIQIKPERLPSMDQIDLLVGLGEALYLDGLYGASAELFESALPWVGSGASAPGLDARSRERLLDWWATALDREAQRRLAADGSALYARILSMMQQELSRDPGSVPASYWMVAASRAIGDLERAWDAAIAGWVRAGLAGSGGARLREDLDRLVLQAIIPERVRLLAESDRDRERIGEELRAEWEGIKKDWKRDRSLDRN
jgi:hypothetical protein